MSVVDPTLTALTTVVEDLAACLAAQIEADENIPPCFCGVLPGFEVAWDIGQCDEANGLAYVRVAGVYPSSSVGVASLIPGNCAVGLGFDLEIGMLRCFDLNEDGSPSSPEQLLEATQLQLFDVQTMRRTLACCDWLGSNDYVVGTYQPVGPSGGVVGGAFPLSGWLP